MPAAVGEGFDRQMTAHTEDSWILGEHTFHSRIIVGTGKYASHEETRDALAASGAEMVTVALRRIDFQAEGPSLLDIIDREKYILLPNTAGCYSADEAVRTLHLARELGMDDFVKLEVIGDPKTLFPDNTATVEAARRLVDEGFRVLPYCSDDLVTCKRLQDVGCLAVMPLAAPIGSGLGIRNPHNIRLIIENVDIPVIVDAGVGTASDAAVAMELGCTAVLMNTGIAGAQRPVLMAEAMREAVSGGRKAFLAGRMPRRSYANASSPEGGLIE
ncbi:thiazole biosynthesis family protein [Haliangium ochraceum DSM 14365]|uniref:Thiazole synthase n=2 Tax=Haliangium ochraceum TaxID=80816 RepID=D0LJM8_HALO1|nr:thiazole biosynthesis family protein [Haliangium ochraceum DSM 14365]